MPGIKKLMIPLFLLLTSMIGAVLSSPANAAPNAESTTWKLIQSFQKTMGDIQARNQAYWWVFALLMLLFMGLFVYLYYTQKKSPKKMTGFTLSSSSKSKRALMRMDVQQNLLYAKANENVYRKGKTINISGGGLLFATNMKYQQNDTLKIAIELEHGEVMRVRGRIVRIAEKSDDDDKNKYMLGIQFTDISHGEQDRIIQMVLNSQRGSIIEEKRRKKRECIFCGQPIPDEAGEDALYCPDCIDYELSFNENKAAKG